MKSVIGRLPSHQFRAVLLGCALFGHGTALAQTQPQRLFVVLSVDQMRFDFLERFGHLYKGGLARLLEEGAVYTDAYQDHFYTSTAAGHATISTGVFPSRSGIVANSWWDRKARRRVYAVADPKSPIVDRPDLAGRSPANMQRNALGDWLKRESRESKVFSVSLKDRSAITMGGERPDGVYWYDSDAGRFITSEYYLDAVPEWVREFNDAKLADGYFEKEWTRLLPEEAYSASREDSFPFESDGVDVTFPHRFDIPADSEAEEIPESMRPRYPSLYYDELKRTPFVDELTFAFIERMIVSEQLGADDVPDLLFVGASAADYIGHRYGPLSQETQDYYLRLDQRLDEFLNFLDATVGEGRFALVLTSDHGVLPIPEELARQGIDAKRIDRLVRQGIVVPPLTDVLSEFGLTEKLAGVLVSPYGVTMRFETRCRNGTRDRYGAPWPRGCVIPILWRTRLRMTTSAIKRTIRSGSYTCGVFIPIVRPISSYGIKRTICTA
ncbi:MAG: alkaline phosphatase family protein [Gemmatimonadetes bacterium]|nr:alkaline phosphatase family protein [Gemmatimonadota bacterium]